jgi:hypothetical protein
VVGHFEGVARFVDDGMLGQLVGVVAQLNCVVVLPRVVSEGVLRQSGSVVGWWRGIRNV